MADISKEDFIFSEDVDLEEECQQENENLEEQLVAEDIKPTRKLDYSLKTPEERNELVKKIIDETPPEQLTNNYLTILADYIIFAMDKAERQQKKILTENRMVTVNKRETSFQGLAEQLENGEDGIYNMMIQDKNIILMPKISITQQDLDDIPALRELHESIEEIEKQMKAATGKKKFLLKKQLIEMHQDQYVIRSAYRRPMYMMNVTKSFSKLRLDEKVTIDENGDVKSNCIVSLYNPKHISALLCNYSQLKADCYGKFWSDSYYLMQDLENLINNTLKDKYPLYYDLLTYKIDGIQNADIQKILEQDYGIKHSVEYISSLWRNKIPKLLAEQAKEDYLMWYYTTQEYGKWKKCSRCGEIKLAHNRFFSKNKTSKDGWYSICKCCRNKKK
jgi:hypothetical protein